MKVRTVGQLQQYLSRSLAWRKKELTLMRFCVDTAPAGEHEMLLRAAVTLLYSHWEGYIKDAATAYLRHITLQQPMLDQLKDNFVAVSLRRRIQDAGHAQTTVLHSQLVQLFRSGLKIVAAIPSAGIIRTRANLKSEVLREIIFTLGLDYTPFEVKEKAVVDRLVGLRNAVAHGRGAPVDAATYAVLHSGVIEMLDEMKDQVDVSAGKRAYIA